MPRSGAGATPPARAGRPGRSAGDHGQGLAAQGAAVALIDEILARAELELERAQQRRRIALEIAADADWWEGALAGAREPVERDRPLSGRGRTGRPCLACSSGPGGTAIGMPAVWGAAAAAVPHGRPRPALLFNQVPDRVLHSAAPAAGERAGPGAAAQPGGAAVLYRRPRAGLAGRPAAPAGGLLGERRRVVRDQPGQAGAEQLYGAVQAVALAGPRRPDLYRLITDHDVHHDRAARGGRAGHDGGRRAGGAGAPRPPQAPLGRGPDARRSRVRARRGGARRGSGCGVWALG
jgi:hypothetical protein